MKTAELRNGLHEIIDSIEDRKLLEAAYYLLRNHRLSEANTPQLQQELESLIQAGEDDIKLGRVHTHEDVKAYFDKKMSK